MGKEYITDTITLEGVETFNEETSDQSKISQINYKYLESEPTFPDSCAFATQIIFNKRLFGVGAETTISIGGFEDSTLEFIDPEINAPNKIKLYTGEPFAKNMVQFYPGRERFTIDKRGYVGINSPDIFGDKVTLDVRSTTPIPLTPEATPRAETPVIAITHPYFNQEGSKPPTPRYIGRLQFRSIQEPSKFGGKGIVPTDMAAIQVETDGEANVYEDPTVNLSLYTNTAGREGEANMVKYLEINGYEKKTKIFTQLNLSNVPAFRDQEEAVKLGGLVNGDVWRDTDGNLKIIFGEQDEEQRAKG
jgi:hypothetical protein